MSEIDRKEILELLSSGKITAAEAADLLNGIKEKQPEEKQPEPVIVVEETPVSADVLKAQETAVAASKSDGKKPNWLHVRVSNMETGKNKVTVNIPLRMVNFGLKVGRKFSSDLEGLDLDSINEMVGDMEQGVLVDVQDEESNEHVQIYVD